jgi:hypothetical protein
LQVSDYLAIWGAVTGTVGSFVAIANLRRDRATVRVSAEIKELSYKSREPPSLIVRVTNIGKQPITIAEVALAVKWRSTGWLRRQSVPERTFLLNWSRESDEQARDSPRVGEMVIRPRTRMLNPGEVLTTMDSLDSFGEPSDLRPYAADALGRPYWASVITADTQRRAFEENERLSRYYD